ncbi:MAG TPA: aminoglycoside phosphotransferase family protein, partial [Gemmatimonadales bacterium]
MWNVSVESRTETSAALIGYGSQDGRPVVLKIAKRAADEWRAGEALAAFDGIGVARACAHEGGALLVERLLPGDSLVGLALDGRDEEATEILATVMATMSPRLTHEGQFPTVEDWGRGFARYA